MKTSGRNVLGWNGHTYVAGDISNDLLALLKHIAEFWHQGSRGWAPQVATDSLQNIDFQRMLLLAEEFPKWYSGEKNTEGQLLLAWVALGAIAEGSLQWFLSVYKQNYLDGPQFRRPASDIPIPPEELFFAKLIAYFEKHVWIDGRSNYDGWSVRNEKAEMTAILHTIRECRNAIHCRKTNVGSWADWRMCIRQFLSLLCELEGRVPYPDEQFAYPSFVAEIIASHSLAFNHEDRTVDNAE